MHVLISLVNKMYTKHVIFVILYYISHCSSIRINFSKCDKSGFRCIAKNKNIAVIYECPIGTNDVTIYPNQFNGPTNIESLTIKNCQMLTVSTRCSSERKAIQTLEISNIERLIFQRLPYQSHLPPTVVLKNITYIEDIPSFTFSQVERSSHTIGCIIPVNDFHSILIQNVSIDIVRPNAFYLPNKFGNVTFSNVKINRLQSSALKVNYDKSGEFLLVNSTVEVLEHLALQIVGRKVTISSNKFVDISSSGINGTIETLYFVHNSVNALESYGISILVKNVHILNNRFEYLKSGALERISPGLMEDSGKNFGTLKFTYDFSQNYVNFMDAGSLNPDFVAYENVATDVFVGMNKLMCSCENIAWLLSEIGHGYNTDPLRDFYETILDEQYYNTCAYSSCDLKLAAMKRMIKNGKCMGNITVEVLCEDGDEPTTFISPTQARLDEPDNFSFQHALLTSQSAVYVISNFLVVISVLCCTLIVN